MGTSLRERFREVDRIPTPWDERAVDTGSVTPSPTRGSKRVLLLGASAAAAALVVALIAIIGDGPARTGHASWLTNTQGSCVEQFSPRTLANRTYAFEGVITDVQPPANPESPDPSATTTTVTFRVERWFWGGTGAEVSRRTYALASSAGELDESIGARLLVSGDEDFIWSCGFTKPATETALSDYVAAAGRRGG